jgi:hypothetical protein
MNAAPTFGSLLFDKSDLQTNDTLQVQVLDAVDADGDLVAAEASARDDYVSGVTAIETALASTEASIESTYAFTVSAALAAWHVDEDEAWTTYDVAMANVPGTPELGSRVCVPPAIEQNGGYDLGHEIFLVQTQGRGGFAIYSVTITPPDGWDGHVGDLGTTFTVTIAGVGRPNDDRIIWSVWDDDGYWTPDDKLQDRRDATVTYGQGNTWTVTRTFMLFANSSGYVAGVDDHSGESEAEIYVYVEAYDGPGRFATKVKAQSEILTVRASRP